MNYFESWLIPWLDFEHVFYGIAVQNMNHNAMKPHIYVYDKFSVHCSPRIKAADKVVAVYQTTRTPLTIFERSPDFIRIFQLLSLPINSKISWFLWRMSVEACWVMLCPSSWFNYPGMLFVLSINVAWKTVDSVLDW